MRLLAVSVGLGLAFAVPACSSAPALDEARSGAESAFTVEHGDEFVISATPDEVVLKKKVGDVAFPFDADALRGKALLIHPVHGKTEGGAYLRAKSVEDDLDRLVVTGETLSLHEMEDIAEDDVVRIYMTRERAEWDGTIDLAKVPAFWRSMAPITGVTVAHEVQEATLTPTPLVKWTKDEGLELGMRLDVAWKSTLSARGGHAGEIFRSPTFETPPYVVLVPIGPVPVPVTLTASAFVSCVANVNGLFDLSVAFDAQAKVAGSVRIKNGIEEGSLPATADGSVSVVPTFAMKERMSVACTIPRIELRAAVASVAGAYLAIVPVAEISTDERPVAFEAAVYAGVDARVLGLSLGKETKLYSWKPL